MKAELNLPALRRVLHFAPEQHIALPLAARLTGGYIKVDLKPQYDVSLDITSLPFHQRSCELVVCCHVLEHIPDDRAALNELHRILSPGGRAIIQVPMTLDGGPTDEDPSLSPESRTARFGQADHVRRYGVDLRDRMADSGFDVEVVAAGDYLGQRCADLAIPPLQMVFVGSRSTT